MRQDSKLYNDTSTPIPILAHTCATLYDRVTFLLVHRKIRTSPENTNLTEKYFIVTTFNWDLITACD